MPDQPRKRRKPPTAAPLGGRPAGKKPPVRTKPKSLPQAAPPPQTAAFDFASLSERHPRESPRRKKRAWHVPVLIAGGVAALCLVAGLLLIDGQPLTIRPIGNREVAELTTLELTVAVDAPQGSGGQPPLKYSLHKAPDGARIDPQTGVFSWEPTEEQGPGLYEVIVGVVDSARSGRRARAKFSVLVSEVNRPPVLPPIEAKHVAADGTLTFTVAAADPDHPPRKLNFRLLPGAPQGARIDARTGRFQWNPAGADPDQLHRFTVRVTEAMPDGLSAEQGFDVRVETPARPVDVPLDVPVDVPVDGVAHDSDAGDASVEPSDPPTPHPAADPVDPNEVPQDVTAAPAADESEAELLDLHKQKKLLARSAYPTLRKIFAARFQRRHRDEIKLAYGTDHEEMARWLDARPDVKEELYTAIDPDHDDVPAALALFKQLKDQFPDEVQTYTNLAIATAVAWDQPGGIYDYVHHQRRTRSQMPEGRLGALANFQYVIAGEKSMQTWARFLPWEFLVHVVNHKTPLIERQWARGNYLAKIRGYGKCYKDVPYDTEMLNSRGEAVKLSGKEYTLPNLRRFGGVCAMQADFATRVGKSMGVPAVYVGGRSSYAEDHAWVMWVELQNVTKNSISFTLESEGRYRGDKYYVGNLSDPQTGQPITDRQLELRLQTVGLSPQNKRHAALVMKAYPVLRENTEMDVADQLLFLYKVIDLCPGNEDAWVAISKMSREGVVTQKHHKAMMTALDQMFRTFANFPDFTWEIFDDLVAYQDVSKSRAKLYQRLVTLYEQAERPDLACKARLKYTEYLVADKQYKEAVQGLALTIMKFPHEGRYVPQMLDKLEEICGEVEATQQQLVEFYQAFLPRIPQMRGDRPSPYCVKMFERGIDRFEKSGQTRLAQIFATQLARIKAGKGRKP